MRSVCSQFIVLVLSAIAFAQAPLPAGKVPGAKNPEPNVIYAGFARTFTDFGSGYSFNGVDVSYTRYLSRRVGLVGQFNYGKNGPFEARYFAYRGGVRYDFKKGRVRPFGQFVLGRAHFRGIINDDPPIGMKYWGFSWAGGGGVDMRMTRRFGARVQFDHERVPFGSHEEQRADWNKLSGGVTFRW